MVEYVSFHLLTMENIVKAASWMIWRVLGAKQLMIVGDYVKAHAASKVNISLQKVFFFHVKNPSYKIRVNNKLFSLN